MRSIELGSEGLYVSAMGFGCMGLSGSYGAAQDEESTAAIRRAYDLGIDFFDTGDFYGGGHNERLLAEAVRGLDGIRIATKTGVVRTEKGLGTRGDGAYIREACDASLARLGREQIDLYYLARVDPQVPIEESVGAMAELVDAGKVRFLGLSEASAATLRRACAVHPISALQTEYSLIERHVEDEVLPVAQELGVGFVASSPLARGLLAGQVRSLDLLDEMDFRRRSPRFAAGNLEQNLNLVDAVAQLAAERDATPAQVVLGWLYAKHDRLVAIPGSRSPARTEENVAALDLELSASDLERLDDAYAAHPPAGDRYPAPVMRTVGL